MVWEEEDILETLNLHGTWNVKSPDGRYNFESEVPGSLFHTLELNGEFGEEGVFFRENNRVCTEIADRDFIFRGFYTVNVGDFEEFDVLEVINLLKTDENKPNQNIQRIRKLTADLDVLLFQERKDYELP